MTDLIFIRHGETDWNLEGRWQGQADVPLNAAGLAQAERLAIEMQARFQLDAVYASDLMRAHQTAEPIARLAGLPVICDPRLREIHQGDWQGLLVGDIQKRYEQDFQNRHADPWRVAPPGGETAEQVRTRLAAALHDIIANYPLGTVAVVTHGFVLAIAQVLCTDKPLEQIWDLVPEHCTPLSMPCAKMGP